MRTERTFALNKARIAEGRHYRKSEYRSAVRKAKAVVSPSPTLHRSTLSTHGISIGARSRAGACVTLTDVGSRAGACVTLTDVGSRASGCVTLTDVGNRAGGCVTQ